MAESFDMCQGTHGLMDSFNSKKIHFLREKMIFELCVNNI